MASESAKDVTSTKQTRILVDQIHSTHSPKDNNRLTKTNYGYKEVHSFARLFDHLGGHSYGWDIVDQGELTLEKLNLYNIVFINVPDRESVSFTAQEVMSFFVSLCFSDQKKNMK